MRIENCKKEGSKRGVVKKEFQWAPNTGIVGNRLPEKTPRKRKKIMENVIIVLKNRRNVR